MTRLALEILYFTGLASLLNWSQPTLGVILKLERVRPAGKSVFQPMRSREITPHFLDRMLKALRRWNYRFVSIDELHELLSASVKPRGRFVCLTFDIGYRDFLDHAWPILKKHGIPAALYVPASFPDHLGELWWLALQEVIARHHRIGFVLDRIDRRVDCGTLAEKQSVFDDLYATMRAMSPAERSAAIRDLCNRYQVDLAAISASATLTWPEIATVADHPLLTIGSATLNYPILAQVDRQTAERELRMGRAVVEAAIGKPAPHCAYPFGLADTFTGREIMTASEIGFATAVTGVPAVITAGSRDDLLALPRIVWDGRLPLRALRVMMAGLMLNSASRKD